MVGFDIEPQPNYPFEFHQTDVLTLDPVALANEFDALHGSPPCQRFTALAALHDKEHPDLIPPTRDLLAATGLPYVIENVVGAPLIDPIQVCGSALALRVRRHRLFECSFPAVGLACQHEWQDRHRPYLLMQGPSKGPTRRFSGVVPVYGGSQVAGGDERFVKAVAMGIDWMTADELNQAIPPAYTLHIGRQLAAHAVASAAMREPDREAGTGSLFRLGEVAG